VLIVNDHDYKWYKNAIAAEILAQSEATQEFQDEECASPFQRIKICWGPGCWMEGSAVLRKEKRGSWESADERVTQEVADPLPNYLVDYL
jgi:hypothetical protein